MYPRDRVTMRRWFFTVELQRTCLKSPTWRMHGAIESFLRRDWTITGVPEYYPADFRKCAGGRRNSRIPNLFNSDWRQDEGDEMCCTGPGGLWSCIHDRLRKALEQRSLLHGLVKHGVAVLANGGQG